MSRRVGRALAALLLVVGALAAIGYRNARADPAVRRMTVRLPHWPAGAAPVRVLLWSDIHLGNRVTGPERLARLVAIANALHPDLIVLAGDYVAGRNRVDAGVAPRLAALGRLRARLGVVAVLGNHEWWTDAPRIRRELESLGVTVLANAAVRRGPLALGGLDDIINGRADLVGTILAMRRLPGAPVLISHSPGVARQLPDDIPLLLAGHTHCGQIVLPWIGPLSDVSAPLYRCGAVREGPRLTIVTAGTGTSVLPVRFGAPPDVWLLTLGP